MGDLPLTDRVLSLSHEATVLNADMALVSGAVRKYYWVSDGEISQILEWLVWGLGRGPTPLSFPGEQVDHARAVQHRGQKCSQLCCTFGAQVQARLVTAFFLLANGFLSLSLLLGGDVHSKSHPLER